MSTYRTPDVPPTIARARELSNGARTCISSLRNDRFRAKLTRHDLDTLAGAFEALANIIDELVENRA